MSNPITNARLEQYICDFENVSHFNTNHLVMAGISLMAGGIIGGLAYAFLANGMPPLHLGMSGNIAAAVIAGAAITSIAIIGVLMHFALNLTRKQAAASSEAFLMAITDPKTDAILTNTKKGGWVKARFDHMLKNDFSDTQWKEMMQFLDQRYFKTTGATTEEETIFQVFSTFFNFQPTRFIRLFYEMKSEELLSKSCVNLLESAIAENLESDPENERWIPLIQTVDKHYFKKRSKLKNKNTQVALLNVLIRIDPKKFISLMDWIGGTLSPGFQEMLKLNKNNIDTQRRALNSLA